jgi:hypothetical protein
MLVLDSFAIVIIRHLRHTWWSALFALPHVVGEGETADTSRVRLRLGIISPFSVPSQSTAASIARSIASAPLDADNRLTVPSTALFSIVEEL